MVRSFSNAKLPSRVIRVKQMPPTPRKCYGNALFVTKPPDSVTKIGRLFVRHNLENDEMDGYNVASRVYVKLSAR